MEKKLKSEGLKGIVVFFREMENTMEKIVNMVRGNLTTMETLTIGALIVLEVHNKDVIRAMIDDQIEDYTYRIRGFAFSPSDGNSNGLVKCVTTGYRKPVEFRLK